MKAQKPVTATIELNDFVLEIRSTKRGFAKKLQSEISNKLAKIPSHSNLIFKGVIVSTTEAN
jgi:hypothetical protein